MAAMSAMGRKRNSKSSEFQFEVQSFLVSRHIRVAVAFLKSIDPSAVIASTIADGSATLRLTACGLSFWFTSTLRSRTDKCLA